MNFKYYDYQVDLFKEIISQQAEVYLFKNYQDLKEAVRVYQPAPLTKQSLFLTINEFKKRLFSSEQIVVKEEKLALILFSVLTSEQKKDLQLDNYQDIHQFTQRFFAYFNLLNNYQIQEFKQLTDWQKERIKRLENIKLNYQKKLNKLGYVDQLTLRENGLLNFDFLADYQKINFFNVLEFTPYFKDIIQKLSHNFQVELHLQLLKGDFNEQNLSLTKISLPKLAQQNLEIRKNNSKLKSLTALLNELNLSQKETEIIDPASEIEAAPILGQKLNFAKTESYRESDFYVFLESLYQLYQKGKSGSQILLELPELYALAGQKLFKKWLDLDAESLLELKKIIGEDYYYLDQDIIENKLPAFEKLLKFLKELRQIKTSKSFIKVLSDLAEKLLSNEAQELIEKFNDSLLALKSIEEMKIVDNWQDYYSDLGAGLFSLLLNQLKYKTLKRFQTEKSIDFLESDRAAQKKRKKLLLNNCIQSSFALEQDGLFFLSEKQLQANGLELKHKQSILKKYYFLRHVLNSQKAVIFTVENETENISPAVILEELLLNSNLEFKDSKLKSITEKEILNNLFTFDSTPLLKVNNLSNFQHDLVVRKEDFGSSFNFSYYKYKSLKDCHHRFYLEHLLNLAPNLEISPSLSLMTLGILTHQIFGDLMIYAKKTKIMPSQIKESERQQIIKKAIKKNELKIDKDYLNYYNQIIFKSLDSSFIRFAHLLKKYLPEDFSNILVEWPEWNRELEKYFEVGGIDFYLAGRIDLLLLNKGEYFIIDFKTGSGDQKQLDFYSLMLRQNYNKKLAPASRKAIYNIFEQSFEHSYHKIEKEAKLGAELEELSLELFNSGEYERLYKSRCQRCPYQAICRVEVKENEKSN